MGTRIDLTGQSFGKWKVVCSAASPKGLEHQQFWLCQCECGEQRIRKGGQLRYAEKQGKVQMCNSCAAKYGGTTHGLSKIPEYKVWHSMLERCNNPEHRAFADYGGRGIKVCERWHSFENFIADMGRRPCAGFSIDRIDNSRGYEPGNCRWATGKTQNRNRRGNFFLTLNGKTQTISAWAEETGIGFNTIRLRIKNQGWSAERALTTPITTSADRKGTSYKNAQQYQFNGQSKSLSDWARHLGVPLTRLQSRLKRGWDIERVLGE